MPIIKSAIRRVKTAATRAKRNQATRNNYKQAIKDFAKLVEEGNQKEAIALLPATQKAIDMAAKKGLIHKNNAAHKKSKLAKMVSGEAAPKAEPKAAAKKPAATKKPAAKKAVAKKPAAKKAAPKKDA